MPENVGLKLMWFAVNACQVPFIGVAGTVAIVNAPRRAARRGLRSLWVMMSTMALLLLIGGAFGMNITFSKESYHAIRVMKSDDCISPRDVHRLTGTVNDVTGGVLTVHIENGTLGDYTMHVGGLRYNHSKYDHSLTATVVCKGRTINLSGMFLIAHGFSAEFYFTEGELSHDPPVAFFLHGPNPPPPPPACATTGAASQSACDAVKPSNGGVGPACAWCESKDGVHKLCFMADHKPAPTGWDCDR